MDQINLLVQIKYDNISFDCAIQFPAEMLPADCKRGCWLGHKETAFIASILPDRIIESGEMIERVREIYDVIVVKPEKKKTKTVRKNTVKKKTTKRKGNS